MMAEILEFTGSTSVDMPPNKVLKFAEDLKEVVVVGIDADDEIYVAGSKGTVANVVYLLEMAKLHMLRLGES